jgi:hypothetical protein
MCIFQLPIAGITGISVSENHHGKAGIRQWIKQSNEKYHTSMEALPLEQTGDQNRIFQYH